MHKHHDEGASAPVEVPDEFFSDIKKAILDDARGSMWPLLVAVLFLVRPGFPDSAVTWEPEFGDKEGLGKIEDDVVECSPYLLPGEKLEARMYIAVPLP